MKLLGILALALFLASLHPSWAQISASERALAQEIPETRIQMAIEILNRVPSGNALIARSIQTWKLSSPNALTGVVKGGPISRTDAVLTRHFDPETGKESREREVMIYINEDQSLVNMILDLAHEMVHANSRPSWDPYDPGLTAGQYIRAAIDGEGGEVEAVKMECSVALELSKNYQIPSHRCKNYVNPKTLKVEASLITRDFYKVGKWYAELVKVLGPEVSSMMPVLSADQPELYSSTGNAPYPVALLKEYQQITDIACQNSRNRFQSYSMASVSGQSSPRVSRAPASTASNDPTALFLERRCHEPAHAP